MRLPDVNGFTVIEYSVLSENAEQLVSFAGIRDGLNMAARLPDVPANTGNTVIRVVIDPRTCLASIQVRDRYDDRSGK